MSNIAIPEHLLGHLGPEMKMDVHWVDVLLKDQSMRKGLVVRGGQFITGRKADPQGEGTLDFTPEDILTSDGNPPSAGQNSTSRTAW